MPSMAYCRLFTCLGGGGVYEVFFLGGSVCGGAWPVLHCMTRCM